MIKKTWVFLLSFVVVMSFILVASPSAMASSNTYYVSTTGSDSNLGTLSSPFLTIQKASSVMVAGDTVLIRGGTYHETIIPSNNGTVGAPAIRTLVQALT